MAPPGVSNPNPNPNAGCDPREAGESGESGDVGAGRERYSNADCRT